MRAITIFFFSTALSLRLLASTVSGTALLDDTNDYSGIKIQFIPASNSADSAETISDASGNYSIEVSEGIYTIEYSREGYQSYLSDEIFINADISLETVTLNSKALKYISGSVEGAFYKDTTYVIIGNVSIQNDRALIIQEGTVIKFDGYYSFTINGVISSNGSNKNPVILTSNKNTPTQGDWAGIRFSGQAGSIIKNTHLEYGGGSDFSDVALLQISNSNLLVDSCKIYYSNEAGIKITGGNPEIRNSEIAHIEGWALRISSGSGQIRNNRIHNNGPSAALVLRNGAIAERNLIFNNSGDGILCPINSGSKAIITKNIIYNNGNGIQSSTGGKAFINYNSIIGNGDGIEIEEDSNIDMEGNIISQNSTGIIIESPSSTTSSITFNLLQNNTNFINPPTGVGQIITTNQNGTEADTYFNIFESPDFYSQDVDNNYYTYLKPTSQAINAGNPNNLDPDGSIADMGAITYNNKKPDAFNLISSSLSHFSYDSIALDLNWQNSIDIDSIATSVYYRLTILNEFNQEVLAEARISDTTLTIKELDILKQNESYKWIVESSDDLETTLANDTLTFETPNLPPSQIVMVTPENGTTIPEVNNVILGWEDNLDTDECSYSLIFKGAEIDTLINQITNSYYDISNLVIPNKSYAWSLIASDSQDSTFSDTLSFFTPNIAPTQFDLLAPINNDTLQSFDEVSFLWNESFDIEPLVYDLHIFNQNFDTLILVGEDTSIILNLIDLLPNTLYSWEVSASDGIATTYSAENTLQTDNIAPSSFELLTPENNQALSQIDSIVFIWTSATDQDDLFYNIHIEGNSKDTTLYSIADTAIVFRDKSFFESSETYSWSVTAYDLYDSTYSDPLTFVSPLILSLTNLSNQIEIFPNPFKESIKIISDFSIKNIELFELSGKIIPITNKIIHENEIEIKPQSEIKGGIYLLRLFGANGEVFSFRIIRPL